MDTPTRKYRNISETNQTLVGVGDVEPGKTVEVTFEIVNPNFEEVAEKKPTKRK